MGEFDDRYGRNTNQWRRTYGYTRHKPNIVTFYDSGLGVSRSVDLYSYTRHRDFFEIEGFNRLGIRNPDWLISGSTSGSVFFYEEGLVFFDYESEKTVNFINPFTGAPYVVYFSVPNVENSHNINAFGTALPTSTQMFIGTSVPYTGYVHYIAMSSSTGWSVAYVSGSSTHVTAGEINLINSTTYTASYSLPAGSYIFYDTVHENHNSFTADVNTENDSVDSTTATNSLSAETTNKLHFIIFKN